MIAGEKISFRLYNAKEGGMGWSKGLEICYVLKGNAHFDVMKNEPCQVSENDVFVINLYDMYQILPEPDGMVLALVIPEELALNLYPELKRLRIECFSFLFEDMMQEHFDKVRKGLAELFELYNKNDPQMQLRMRGAASSLLSELIGCFGKSKEGVGGSVNDSEDYVLGKKGIEQLSFMIEYVQQHYREEISLAKFSEKSYYSPSHLSHLMRKELGISFTEYLKMVRLQHALQLLRHGKSVTEISESTGFVNSNAFIKAFRDTYGMTPGKYKSMQQKSKAHNMPEAALITDLTDAESHLFDRLFSYLDKKELTGRKGTELELCKVKVDVGKSKREMSESWKFSVNGGYAKRLLYGHVQSVLCKIQKEIGFRYIRCKGIFEDELQVCTRDRNGKLVFNFVYLDTVLDFICSCNARPWVEFSYMPSALCTKYTKGEDIWLIAMPDALQEWLLLVRQTVLHMKERYGEKEVSGWIVTPFADIFLVNTHMQNRDGYFELYEKTCELIRTILPQTKIAARGTFEEDGTGLGDYMVKKKLFPDYWTMVDYNSVSPAEENGELDLVESMEAYSMVTSRDTERLKHQIARQKKELDRQGIGNIPLVLAEWNSTIWQRDLCSDTVYKACWLLKGVLENCNDISGFSYWHASDWNDDYPPSLNRFHGGFGLFTRDDIPKAAYGALLLLNRAEGKIQGQGKGYFVLRTEEKVMVYLYHYCPYDILYCYRHIRDISQNNRYGVFESKNDICYHIELKGLPEGIYRKRVYQIDRKAGSSCDIWMQMGVPEKLDESEYEYIFAASMPKYSSSRINIQNEYVVQSVLEPHTIQLIELQRV